MNAVNPNKITTIFTNGAYQPLGFWTARAALHNLLTGKCKALDRHYNTHDWPSWLINRSETFENTPALRSIRDSFPVPTITVVTHYFGYRVTAGKEISLRKLYNLYKGVCAYTHEKIPFSEASIDHWYPKSKGGLNTCWNVVLCKKSMNSKKGDSFPFYDVNGNEVHPKIFLPFHHATADSESHMRDEWKPLLFKE